MKALILFSLLAFTSIGFAAPVCYVTDDIMPKLPKEICFEKLEVNVDTEVLSMIETKGVLPSQLPLYYFARRNENGYSFRASDVYFDQSEGGCGYAAKVVIHVMGKTDNDGLVGPSYLDVSAEYKYTFDSCHSQERMGKAIYKLKH